MSWLLAILVVVAFAWIVHRTGLPAQASDSIQRARASQAVVRDRSLSDAEKERMLRGEAPRLLALFARIATGTILALLVPLAALWALDRVGLASRDEVLAILARVDFLLAVTGLGILAYWLRGRRPRL
jgi:hypothetical protein